MAVIGTLQLDGTTKFLGLSTDAKPTFGLAGSIFEESDTGKPFGWTGAVWVAGGGGGGGNSPAILPLSAEYISYNPAGDQSGGSHYDPALFTRAGLTLALTFVANGFIGTAPGPGQVLLYRGDGTLLATLNFAAIVQGEQSALLNMALLAAPCELIVVHVASAVDNPQTTVSSYLLATYT